MLSSEVLAELLGPLAPDVRIDLDPLQAWAGSGAMWLTGRAGGPPLAGGNGAGIVAASLIGALGVTRPLGTPPPPGTAMLGERAAVAGLHRSGSRSAGGAARVLETSDGPVALSLPRAEDLELVPALVELEPGAEPWAAVVDWCQRRTSAEVVARARLLGLAVGALAEDGERHRSFRPGAPAAFRKRPLVVDLTSLWAGPLCAHLLARQGAEVIKVESPLRPDGARRGPAGFFDLLHAHSKCVSLNLSERWGREELHDLVTRADVVLSSSRPRALSALGLDPETAADRGTIWTSITAHGQGQGADRIGFGDDVAVAAGLVAHDSEGVVFAGDALADPLTGLAAAAATSAALTTGHGWFLDMPMVRVARVAAGASVPPAPVESTPDGWAVEVGGEMVPVRPPAIREPHGCAPTPGQHNRLLGVAV